MRVTFPHMGTLHLAVRALLQALGVEVVVPPRPSQRTVRLGARYAPEVACLPLKVSLGNLIEAFEMGADTAVMAGGSGPCRFGYYAQVQREILADLGFTFEMLVLEPPQGDLRELLSRAGRLTRGNGPGQIWRAARLAWEKVKAADAIQAAALRLRAREAEKGWTTRIEEKWLATVDAGTEMARVRETGRAALRELSRMPCDGTIRPLRVGMVGEVYVVLEPFVNLDIERKLGEMGAEVHRSIYLSDWVRQNVFLPLLGLRGEREVVRAARPYLGHFVGGHGLDTVGHTVMYARAGYDGAIHLLPFGCMPELVAQSVLSQVSEDLGIPVLTVAIDEHASEAGFVTRLEAFLDLLERKRRREEGDRGRLPRGGCRVGKH